MAQSERQIVNLEVGIHDAEGAIPPTDNIINLAPWRTGKSKEIMVVLVTECRAPDRAYRLDQKLSKGSIPLAASKFNAGLV